MKLQSLNALDRPEFSNLLSPMTRHAIYLTSVLGERYLWIDALCIVHGDTPSTMAQLKLMGAIYANATVTIVAADEDSNVGIPGIQGVSGPRQLQQRVIPFGEEQVVVDNSRLYLVHHEGKPYFKRGWTFQEYQMSTRKILFYKNEVHWICPCGVRQEDSASAVQTALDHNLDADRFGSILAGFPDLNSLNSFLLDHNERDFRYEEDALPGISGFLAVLSRSFPGGFLYGLPEIFFDRALGWEPWLSNTNLRRRVGSARPSENRVADSALPSWSWMGWQGQVSIGYNEAARIDRRETIIEETTPITQWYTSSSPDGVPKRRIHSTWFEARDARKDFSKPLPAGWTRYNGPAQDDKNIKGRWYIHPPGCGEFHFKHENMPIGERDSWFYPFLVPDIHESTPPFTPEQSQYLMCKTKGARVQAFQMSSPVRKNTIKLVDEAGSQIGQLQLHNAGQRDLFPKEGAPGKTIDLVAIYLSLRIANSWDPEQCFPTGPPETTESYRVLWVEWQGGIAYRQAVGNVQKEQWNSLALEDVSLILG